MQPVTQTIRNDWKKHEVLDLYQLPFNDLLYLAHRIFRENHDPNKVQVSTLLSVKTGSCSDGDTVFDNIVDNEKRGAVLRTVPTAHKAATMIRRLKKNACCHWMK